METTFNTTTDIFSLPQGEIFSEYDSILFTEITKPENREWLLSIIAHEPNEAEALYRLAEAIRVEVIEQHQDEINNLSNPVLKDILGNVFAAIDPFVIAKELYRQFKGGYRN